VARIIACVFVGSCGFGTVLLAIFMLFAWLASREPVTLIATSVFAIIAVARFVTLSRALP